MRGERVGARHVALGLAAGADLVDRLGDPLRLGDDPAGQGLRLQLGRREALGLDEPRQDHADVDAVRALLGVEGVGPADERELARRVGAGRGAGDAAGGAGDVDDRARRRGAQQRQQRLGEADDGVEVELHVAADVGVAALGEGAAPGGAGVVDEQVEAAAVLGLEVGADARRRLRLGQVDGEDGGPAGQRFGQRPQALLAAGDEDELGAGLAREPDRGRLPDPARGAGDQRDAHRPRLSTAGPVGLCSRPALQTSYVRIAGQSCSGSARSSRACRRWSRARFRGLRCSWRSPTRSPIRCRSGVAGQAAAGSRRPAAHRAGRRAPPLTIQVISPLATSSSSHSALTEVSLPEKPPMPATSAPDSMIEDGRLRLALDGDGAAAVALGVFEQRVRLAPPNAARGRRPSRRRRAVRRAGEPPDSPSSAGRSRRHRRRVRRRTREGRPSPRRRSSATAASTAGRPPPGPPIVWADSGPPAGKVPLVAWPRVSKDQIAGAEQQRREAADQRRAPRRPRQARGRAGATTARAGRQDDDRHQPAEVAGRVADHDQLGDRAGADRERAHDAPALARRRAPGRRSRRPAPR